MKSKAPVESRVQTISYEKKNHTGPNYPMHFILVAIHRHVRFVNKSFYPQSIENIKRLPKKSNYLEETDSVSEFGAMCSHLFCQILH